MMGYVTKTFTYDGIRYWVRGETEKEAIEKLTRKKLLLEEGKIVHTSSATVNEWFVEFMKTYKQNVTQKTRRDYVSYYDINIKPYIGAMKIGNVKQIDCQKIMNNMQGKSHSYINKVSILLNSLFETAINNGMIYRNPSRNISIPKGEKGSRRALTPSEREIFLKAYHNASKGGLFCAIIYYCGLRPSEVARIEYGDYEDGVLHVRGTKTKAATRDVPIPTALKLPKLKKGRLLFGTKDNNHIDKSVYQHYWKRVVREMNIEMGAKMYRNRLEEDLVADDLTMYCLRHDYCTRLEEAGIPINVACRLMGHSSIQVTSKIYTHDSKKTFENARELIENYNKV